MRQNRSRRLSRDHGTEHVANGERFRTLLLGLPLRGERIRGFAGLADANRKCFRIDDGVAIAEFAAVVHLDRNLREALDHELAGQSRVPAGAASNDLYVGEISEYFLGDIHLVEENLRGIERHTGEKSVANGAGLLEDFLLHVVLVAALFGHDRVPGNMLDGSLDGVAIEIQDADALWSEHRNVAISQEKHLPCVGQDRRNIAGDEILALAQANYGRRAC